MHNLYRDSFSTSPSLTNGLLPENMDSGTGEWTETISQESSPDPDHFSNILPFRGRLGNPETIRSLTYVLLGMVIGVVLLALFIDVSKSSSPASQKAAEKGDSQDGSDSTGAE